MKRNCLKAAFFVAVSILLMSFATQQSLAEVPHSPFQAVNLNPKLQSGEYVQKVNGFVVILDKSGSMGEVYKGHKKLDIAKGLVSHLNQTIPDLQLCGTLRAFGRFDIGYPTDFNKVFYGPTDYSKANFENALGTVGWARGLSPLEQAIDRAAKDLSCTRGQVALIVVSDAKEMNKKLVLKAAQNIKGQYGERLCIYSVFVGKDKKGNALMQGVADAGGCGFLVKADDLASPQQMAEFVEMVFLQKVVIVEEACLDSDGDGVCDDVDKCPNTPKGVKVDSRGCWLIGMVNFDFDKYNIKPQYFTILDNVAAVMKLNPSLQIMVQGNTDNIGSAKYNMGLSERRAGAAKAYLMDKGISGNRISTIGYGFTRPIATNSTDDGRALNRRDEMGPLR